MRSVLLVVVALCGCGAEERAAGNDAAADGASNDASTAGPVTITVLGETAPLVDVPVIFHDRDGANATVVRTDANGVATAEVLAGTSVSVLRVDAMARLFTLADVKPGDQLLATDALFGPTTPLQIRYPIDPMPHSGAYATSSDCGLNLVYGEGGTATQQLVDSCATFDVAVWTLDASGIVGGIVSANATRPPQGPLVLSGPFQRRRTTSLELSNIPAGNLHISSMVGVDPDPRHGLVFGYALLVSPSNPTSFPIQSFAGLDSIGFFLRLESEDRTLQRSVMRYVPYVTQHAVDVAAEMPVGFTGPPTFDVASHAFRWTLDGSGALDVARVDATVARGGHVWSVTVIGPYDGESLVVPQLDVDGILFGIDDPAQLDDVALQAYATAGGWDARRPVALTAIDSYNVPSLRIWVRGN